MYGVHLTIKDFQPGDGCFCNSLLQLFRQTGPAGLVGPIWTTSLLTSLLHMQLIFFVDSYEVLDKGLLSLACMSPTAWLCQDVVILDERVIGNEGKNGTGDIILPANGEVSSGDERGLPSCELGTAARLLWVAADVTWPALGLSTISAALRRSSKGLPLLAGLLPCSCCTGCFSHEHPHASEHCMLCMDAQPR